MTGSGASTLPAGLFFRAMGDRDGPFLTCARDRDPPGTCRPGRDRMGAGRAALDDRVRGAASSAVRVGAGLSAARHRGAGADARVACGAAVHGARGSRPRRVRGQNDERERRRQRALLRLRRGDRIACSRHRGRRAPTASAAAASGGAPSSSRRAGLAAPHRRNLYLRCRRMPPLPLGFAPPKLLPGGSAPVSRRGAMALPHPFTGPRPPRRTAAWECSAWSFPEGFATSCSRQRSARWSLRRRWST